jgi:hypothetical protein
MGKGKPKYFTQKSKTIFLLKKIKTYAKSFENIFELFLSTKITITMISDPDNTYFIMSVWPVKYPFRAIGSLWALFAWF